MPSFTTLAASALALLSAAPLASAVPFRPWPITPVAQLSLPGTSAAHPQILKNRKANAPLLASGLPSTSLTLQYVAIGRGIQNYTCASVGATPLAVGAIATLYDATELAQVNLSVVHAIPPIAVNDAPPAAGHDYTLPPPVNHLSVLGHHYFALDGTPTFNLSSVSKLLYAAKNGDVTAPAGASKGPANTGAVDWLSLVAKTNYDPSIGLGQVYRVETAGGAAPATCSSTNIITVQYSAEYWFYA